MSRSNKWSLRVIDVVGGCAVAACLLNFVWLTLIRPDRARAEIDELTRLLHRTRQDHRAVLAARRRQREALQSYEAKLAKTGQLPTQTPIEQYFQTLSTFASKHRLRVVSHHPLTPRRYPGLLEQRYAYEVSGSLPDLIGFLESIQEADFWADVSYLTVDRGKARNVASGASAGGGRAEASRFAGLTISLFSALPSDGNDVASGASAGRRRAEASRFASSATGGGRYVKTSER